MWRIDGVAQTCDIAIPVIFPSLLQHRSAVAFTTVITLMTSSLFVGIQKRQWVCQG